MSSDLVKRLEIKSGMILMGEKIAWGSDAALMDEAADRITALEAENARLREKLEPPPRPLDMNDPLNKRLYKHVFGKQE